ncbi:MAG: UbiX family flavin prenyltransferase [Microbacteriaceae bacterium]
MSASKPIVVVAISGASGAPIAVRILQLLRESGRYDAHLVITPAGVVTIEQECELSIKEVKALADVVHKHSHIGASIASGASNVVAMLLVPCSIHQLSAVAYGITDDLVSRAADVCLKEGRPLLLMLRESPLHSGHIAAMHLASQSGAIIAPPVPAFYRNPASVADIIDDIAIRALSRVGLLGELRDTWIGIPEDQRMH